jgi:hypothetical protein
MEGTRKVPSVNVVIVLHDIQQDQSRHYLDRNSKYFLSATAWLYAVSRAVNNVELWCGRAALILRGNRTLMQARDDRHVISIYGKKPTVRICATPCIPGRTRQLTSNDDFRSSA